MAYDYNIPAKRAEERAWVEKGEAAHVDLTSWWRTRPKGKEGWKRSLCEQKTERTIQQHPSA